jgi:23S rRNA (pseudouridine1915-N3)-methyltransferase
MKDKRLAALTGDYLKRMRPWARLEETELKDSDPQREAAAQVAYLDGVGAGYVIGLDEHGPTLTSHEMAKLLGTHGSISFLIGGPDGLGEAAKKRADKLLSLSPMTFTHEMARFILVEQIYRGLAINHNHRYHRD